MDPISFSTAITGLLAWTEKISSALYTVLSNIKHAPRSAQSALDALKDMGVALSSIQRLFSDLSVLRPRRRAMIELEHIGITITQSINTLRDLESLLTPTFDSISTRTSAWERLQWAWKEERVSRILQQLERQKSSLSLMLTILQCEFDQDARYSSALLRHRMEDVIQTDMQDIHRRLIFLESSRTHATPPHSSADDDHLTIRELDMDSTFDYRSQHTPSIQYQGLEMDQDPITFNRSFEKLLEVSRAYQRAQRGECDVSFSSSNVRSHAWSALSGVSLADISVISVLGLPLDSDETSRLLLSSAKTVVPQVQPSSTPLQLPPVMDSFKIRRVRKVNHRTAQRLTYKSKDSVRWSPER